MFKTQKQIREAFWRDNPRVSRKLIRDSEGYGWAYVCDTRCAFVDYVDMLARDGQISEELAQRVTL